MPVKTRQSAVAGTFYPADRHACQQQVNALLSAAKPIDTTAGFKGLIVPHAGYIYSGSTAAAGYRLLNSQQQRFNRVLLLGPNHTAPLRGIALPSHQAFTTPLGDVSVDSESIAILKNLPEVQLSDLHHAREHCIEVQLPFLQSILKEFTLIPAIVGECKPKLVTEFISACKPDQNTLIVVSSDLSHYLPHTEAQRIDKRTTVMIEALQPVLVPEQACGCHAINGLIQYSRDRGQTIRCIMQCTSADTAGGPAQVVGYGSYVYGSN